MKTIRDFRIAENQKNFDVVELYYDELLDYYSVRWKWTSMREAQQRDFLNKIEAEELYLERKHFAILCN